MIGRFILLIMIIPFILALIVSLALMPISYIIFGNGMYLFYFFKELIELLYDIEL